MDWIDLPLDRKKWRDFENVPMDLLVPKMLGIS
jgi:hypothetical protein